MNKNSLALPVVLSFLAGLSIMIAEIVAGRLVSRYLGQSLYTWTSCIGVFLAGISIGNFLGGRFADRYRAPQLLSVLFAVAAVLCWFTPVANRLLANWPWLWEQSWPFRIFLHITATFIWPAIALGTIGPIVAKLAVERRPGSASGSALGAVYAWGAVGSVTGTYLCGFVLIARFGTSMTILLSSLLLLGCSLALSVAASRKTMPFSTALLVLGLATMAPESSRGYFLGMDKRYDEMFQAESRYAFISVRSIDGNPNLRAMMLDRLMHSEVNVADPLDVMYGHNRVYAAITRQTFDEQDRRRIYVLGGGGYGFPKYLEAAYPGFDVDVAEFDPEVVEVARTHFGLSTTGRIQSVVQDARTYIDDLLRDPSSSNGVYDAIFSDIVSDYEIPFHLLTTEYLGKVHRVLKPEGYYAFIVIDSQSLGALVSSVYLTAKTIFPQVSVIACSDNPAMRDMFVLVCSKRAIPVDRVIPSVKGQPAFRGSVLSSTTMAEISARNHSFVLTDDHAPVEYMASRLSLIDSDEPVEQLTRAGLEAVHRGDLDTALECLQKAAQRNPKSVPTAFNLAHVLADVGRLDEAAVIVDRAIAVEPDNANMKDFAAMLSVRRGDIETAMGLWRDILSRQPQFMPARNNLATALLLSKQPEKAIEVLEPAVKMSPDNAIAWFNLGNARMSIGKLDAAAQAFEKALLADSGMAEAAYSLGVIELRNGRVVQARRLFLDALERNPQLEAAAEQLKRLGPQDALR